MADNDGFNSEDIRVVRKYALQNAMEYDGKGQAGSVLGRVLAEKASLRDRAKKLLRLVEEEVVRANSISIEGGIESVRLELEGIDPSALEREKHKKNDGLRNLPGRTSKVVLRFAPNPNGPLSIGHSRGIAINSKYAEMYSGKIVLRFDDTDTRVKPPLIEAYKWIEEEFEWLSGKSADIVVRASERMPVYLNYAEKMIMDEQGYVCRCTAEEFRGFRDLKVGCPCRERSVLENMEDWKEMKNGVMSEGDAVVRVKTDMTLPNPALRDWPALRIQHTAHPIVGEKYKVWPLLDFQSAIEDHEQGITHIIRGKDLMDSTRKQTLLYEHFGWEYPETLYWGRVKIHEFGGFSTSSMSSSISSGLYMGWDDPRLPTLRSLRRRGFEPRSIIELWEEIGLSQKDISISMQTVESFNSKIIDKSCERRVFVSDPVSIQITGENVPNKVKISRHPEELISGDREWQVGKSFFIQSSDLMDGEIRLKDFADIKIEGSNAEIESLERTDGRRIVHWIPQEMSRVASLQIPNGEDITELKGLIENFDLRVGRVYQFERVGFARIDEIGEDVVSLIWLHG